MAMRLERPGVRRGYDLWADSYDSTANPVVALDRLHTFFHLKPAEGDRVLDAGCGTGANLRRLVDLGARPIGIDFSRGMLGVAQVNAPAVPLAQADLNHPLPLRPSYLDALLCSLVSEHLTDLPTFFRGAFTALREGGRLVFAAFHPAIATSGVEANFERGDTEYRLGAEPHTTDDYLNGIVDAGFNHLAWTSYGVDQDLAQEISSAQRYLGMPLLFVIEAVRGTDQVGP